MPQQQQSPQPQSAQPDDIYFQVLNSYKENLVLLVDYFTRSINSIHFEKDLGAMLSRMDNLYLLVIAIVSTIMTFQGRRFERISLCALLSILIYTLCSIGSSILMEYFPAAAMEVSQSVKKTLDAHGERASLWVVGIIVCIGTLLCYSLYGLMKFVAMGACGFFLFKWFIQPHFDIPKPLDLVTCLLLVGAGVGFYYLFHAVYLTVFSALFAVYGSLFVLAMAYTALSKNHPFSLFVSTLMDNPVVLSNLLEQRETLIWGITALIGFSIQMRF